MGLKAYFLPKNVQVLTVCTGIFFTFVFDSKIERSTTSDKNEKWI